MRSAALSILSFFVLAVPTASAQVAAEMQVVEGPGSANYRLATRWAPYQTGRSGVRHPGQPSLDRKTAKNSGTIGILRKAPSTTSWIRCGARNTQIFDRDALAAELTRITLDPYDALHLPITSIRFIDENTIEFEVESSQDEEVEEDADEDDVEEEDEEEQEEGGDRPSEDEEEGPPLPLRRAHPDAPGTRRLRRAGQSRLLGQHLARRADGGLRAQTSTSS